MDLLILVLKCILIGIVWAALLMPVVFKRAGALKYIVTVVIIALLCYFFRGYSNMINTMTTIALVALILAWITSMAVFEKESKVKSKVIAFSCIIAGFSYLIATLINSNWQFL